MGPDKKFRFNSQYFGKPLKVYPAVAMIGQSLLSTEMVILCWSISMHFCTIFYFSSSDVVGRVCRCCKFQCLMITTLTGVRGHLIVVLRPSSKSLQTVNAGEGMEKGNPPTLLAGM